MTIAVRSFETLRDAAAVLGRERGARFLGGGTVLVHELNAGRLSDATLVRSSDRALTAVRASGSRLQIGAGVTMAQILGHRELAFLHPAAGAVGGPALRNAATVGGNLHVPAPYGDLTVALLALDARLAVQTGYSTREVSLAEFLEDRGHDARSIVVSVQIARPRAANAFRFAKISRVHPARLPLLTLAAHLPESAGRLSGVRVALGAMGPTAQRARAVERTLEGRKLDAAAISAAVAVASDGCTPPTDSVASAWYRHEVAGVHLRRLLEGASTA